MPSTLYALAPALYWCTIHDFSIILDVDNDRYLSVSARQFEALLSHIDREHFTSSTDLGHESRELPSDLLAFANELEARGILRADGMKSLKRAPMHLPHPTSLISTAEALVPLRHTPLHVPAFLQACVRADYYLRSKTFQQIATRVTARNGSAASPRLEALNYLTRVFHSLRPFYPRPYLCMFDSLAMLEFLASFHLFPRWVFGVTIDPFQAHCWVQQDSLVLCDTRKFAARWFTQILVL